MRVTRFIRDTGPDVIDVQALYKKQAYLLTTPALRPPPVAAQPSPT